MTLLDQRAHVTEKEGQQQRSDMRAVNIRIRHDDDFIITQLFSIEFIADTRAERRDNRRQLIIAVYLVESCFLDVQHFAPQRQDRLEFSVTSLLSGAARGVTLYDVDLCLAPVLTLTVGELTGQRRCLKTGLSAYALSRLSRRLSRLS